MIPTLAQAETFLLEAEQRSPGPWVAHSRLVAQGMRLLAEGILANGRAPSGLDPDQAEVIGLLHDIGRREGVHGMRHILDGYRFLAEQGYEEAGRYCLTHSFPKQPLVMGASQWDGRLEELEFVRRYISGIEYNLYDRLVQLLDGVSMPHGFVLLEKRMVDVAMRYGKESDAPLSRLVERWQGFFAAKAQVEALLGRSIYQALPGVVENTFS